MHTSCTLISNFISEVSGKEWFLFFLSVLVAVWMSFVVGKYLMFRQLVDQVMTLAVSAHAVLKPSSRDERRAIILGIDSGVGAASAQLSIQGHQKAAELIKRTGTDFAATMYSALDFIYRIGPALDAKRDQELAVEFHKWLNFEIGVYVVSVAKAQFSVPVIFFFYKSRRQLSENPKFDSFEDFMKLPSDKRLPRGSEWTAFRS